MCQYRSCITILLITNGYETDGTATNLLHTNGDTVNHGTLDTNQRIITRIGELPPSSAEPPTVVTESISRPPTSQNDVITDTRSVFSSCAWVSSQQGAPDGLRRCYVVSSRTVTETSGDGGTTSKSLSAFPRRN